MSTKHQQRTSRIHQKSNINHTYQHDETMEMIVQTIANSRRTELNKLCYNGNHIACTYGNINQQVECVCACKELLWF